MTSPGFDKCDIGLWVEKAPDRELEVRQAVHTVLLAISSSKDLREQMIMKGAILLALKYESSRYTKDIDFSTSTAYGEFDRPLFLSLFEQHLSLTVEELDYGLDCRLQSVTLKPNRTEGNFQTLVLKVGYAQKGSPQHKRLINKRCINVLEIDYSFNERISSKEIITLSNGGEIFSYGFTDLVAEKLRAILQQESRNRIRRQDVYDLYHLFQSNKPQSSQKENILESLIEKSESRNLNVDKNSMANEEIKRRSKKEYHSLKNEIEETLPDFEKVYSAIQKFYESLPWEK
jgi:predicted nucleotidyltransferase component of viral defense system